MKIRTFVLLLSLGVLFASCEKLGLCKDDELTLDRQDNNTSELKIDGYYHYPIETDTSKSYVFVFYKNGLIYNAFGAKNKKEIEENTLDLIIYNNGRESKPGWGVYKIAGSDIEIQYWPYSMGCSPIITERGEILNDSTIILSSIESSYDCVLNEQNKTLYFKKYSPKPDSTNNFIP